MPRLWEVVVLWCGVVDERAGFATMQLKGDWGVSGLLAASGQVDVDDELDSVDQSLYLSADGPAQKIPAPLRAHSKQDLLSNRRPCNAYACLGGSAA